jgi:hypothetical protein
MLELIFKIFSSSETKFCSWLNRKSLKLN